ncbi:RNA polymerase III [Cavenderia fasciculata]|uniref:DNA-directed RNA polymerase subunit n=1 Tax=Cavenderia fasciculata TaxID=261658 RepID=F4PQ38_CACFS|nr:RNA polymerase III [Cavenderia fasciculata]EGG22501.1 RNA polymerase III [Cavenderia fasciculata]|eukprot:XP_004360352.1 RNA polymerase III [Cavenderia fasciculata]
MDYRVGTWTSSRSCWGREARTRSHEKREGTWSGIRLHGGEAAYILWTKERIWNRFNLQSMEDETFIKAVKDEISRFAKDGLLHNDLHRRHSIMSHELIKEDDGPKKIGHIQFGILSPEDMIRLSHVHIINRELFSQEKRAPMPYGCLDNKLGTSDKGVNCQTCGLSIVDCVGHFGYIDLQLPVFHIGYFKNITNILQMICKNCSTVLLDDEPKATYLRKMRNRKLDVLQRRALFKKVYTDCRKKKICPKCNSVNGPVKKVSALKLIHEKYKKEEEHRDLIEQFEDALKANAEMRNHVKKAQEDLNPLVVFNLFKRISYQDTELLDMDPDVGRPERLILTHLLVPPVSIRPSVPMDGGSGSNEDDLTMKLSEILHINDHIKTNVDRLEMQAVVEDWDYLQASVAIYINSELPGLPLQMKPQKPIRGLSQRLKGKTGRFRGNLSGKRVDFSGRTVISPDPNLNIDEVAIPQLIAVTMTYPERCTSFNIQRLQKYIINGPDKHPGANYIIYPDGEKKWLKYGNREKFAAELKIGDIVERHLIDGDVMLFNRQPSLHKLSIMCHKARVMPWRTLRFNECVCTPYNADFDGDEMNIHCPQTEEARAEALILMGVTNNLITPRNGEPLVAATQDFLTSSYLISRRDAFYDRARFTQMCTHFADAYEHIDLPQPTIVKPIELWTGKQLFEVLLRPSVKSHVLVNFETNSRTYTKNTYMCPRDGYVCFRNSELMCGSIDKSIIGGGNKDSLFHVLMRDFTPAIAANAMTRLAKLCARFLGDQGFSIGIPDVKPSPDLNAKKDAIIKRAHDKCDVFLTEYKSGRLAAASGCTVEQTLEARMNQILSGIRDECGKLCVSELPHYNSPLIMALCGSKGSNINIAQMIACVGQQIVNGTRIPNGFTNRTTPHFPHFSREPKAKGFVGNSFYTGMIPTEFFFHTMGGREGLVDTAVKTAETGYMQRRLMKALEDLSTQYDYTVRDSTGGIVQFIYGDDGLDPAGMEAKERPVDFIRAMLAVKNRRQCRDEKTLRPFEIKKYLEGVLDGNKFIQCTEYFKEEIRTYFYGKPKKGNSKEVEGYIEELVRLRKFLQLPPMLDEDEDIESCGPVDTEMGDATSAGDSYDARFAFKDKEQTVDQLHRITTTQMDQFLDICLDKYNRARIEPGTAVGAIGAQSIGEPGTQMTLKTFHFAGVASMNVTLGVPRIKEIINASKTISTPIITATLNCDDDIRAARIVTGRIEKTTLGQISVYIKEVFRSGGCYLSVKIDKHFIDSMQIEVSAESIKASILGTKGLKLKPANIETLGEKLRIKPPEHNRRLILYSLQFLKNNLPNVIVHGIPTVNRVVISKPNEKEDKYQLLVEGYDLLKVMATPGIKGTHTCSNHIMEVEKVLGIEAVRSIIISEIQMIMVSHGMSIDIRHIMLMADLMCFKGEILGITRFGIAKMKESVLMLASFEKTTDHLFDAAVHRRQDDIVGVSECIIMGIPVPLGTGLFKLLYTAKKTNLPRKSLLLGNEQQK